MKILHCSDIHLGRRPVGGVGDFSNKRYNDYFIAFDQAVDLAVEKKINVFMITGDLFDRKELIPEVLERTETSLLRLVENNVKTLLIEGNHDNITPGKEDDSWIIYLENKKYLKRPFYYYDENGYHFNPVEIEGIDFYGLGYPGGLVNETLTALSVHLQNKKDKNNVVMVHTAISGNEFLPGTALKETIKRFKDLVIYMGGGHFHSYSIFPSTDSFFYIPGSLEYWDLAENSEKKGVIIFDTENNSHEYYPSNPRKKITVKVNVKSDHHDDFVEEIKLIMDDLDIEMNEDIVFLELFPEKPFYIDTALCEEMLLKKGALKGLVRIQYPHHKKENFLKETIADIEEVERELIDTWEVFSKDTNMMVRILGQLKSFQKENNKDQFIDIFNEMLEKMIEQKRPEDAN